MSLSDLDINRRTFLRAGAAIGGGVAATSLLTSCADSGTSPGSGGATGPPKKGGTLSLALYGAAQSDHTDGQHALSGWDIAIAHQMYDSLLSQVRPPGADVEDGLEVTPNLAESAEFEGPRKLVIRLRDGVEFHDGKTMTADDVLFSLRRIADPDNPAPGAPMLANVDLEHSRATDGRTVELRLTKPDAFLRSALASSYLRIYPADWDAKNPVGSGPWKLQEFKPGQSVSFERFDNYFNTPAYADDLQFVGYDDPTALTNALTSGAVNLLANVPASQIRVLESDSRFTVLSAPTGAPTALFAMMKHTAPFTDPRVREAFRLLIDRQSVVDQVYGGRATIGNDLFNQFDPAYNSDLPQREYDPDKAGSLLDEAGVSPVELALATGNYAPNIEVVFSQAAKAGGVTLNVEKIDQSTFYAQHYMQDPLFSSGWYGRDLAQIWALNSVPGALYNETQEDNAEIARLFGEAQAAIEDQQRYDLMKEIQQVQYDEGGYIIPVFPDQVDAMSAQVQGALADVTGKAFGQFNFKDMWLA